MVFPLKTQKSCKEVTTICGSRLYFYDFCWLHVMRCVCATPVIGEPVTRLMILGILYCYIM